MERRVDGPRGPPRRDHARNPVFVAPRSALTRSVTTGAALPTTSAAAEGYHLGAQGKM